MKKRLRKKKHVGEFQEFGFYVWFTCMPELSVETWDEQVLDPFIFELIEGNKLQCGGGGNQDRFNGFVSPENRESATESHRDLVQSWLENHSLIADWHVGELVDAWN